MSAAAGLLAVARHEGSLTGRPVLAWVAPSDALRHPGRGRLLGALLNHGTDAELAPLALAVPVALSAAALGVASPLDEPGAVLLEPDGAARALSLPDDDGCGDREYLAEEESEPLIRAQVARAAAALRGLLCADEAMLRRRAEGERRALGGFGQAVTQGLPEDVQRGLAAQAPALLLLAEGAGAEPFLAAAVRRRYVEKRVPGTRWAFASICGVVVEGEGQSEEDRGTMCGIGYVPRLSQRFLQFYLAGTR